MDNKKSLETFLLYQLEDTSFLYDIKQKMIEYVLEGWKSRGYE